MTLTSLLPTLRHSIPSPFTRDLWPAGAAPTLDDVVVAGISILRYVELCGTPCVTTGSAVIPLSGGVPSHTETTTILTTAVVAVERASDPPNTPVVILDAALDVAVPRWKEARLVGRVSDARDRRFAVCDAAGLDLAGGALILPGDLVPDDLVTVPCGGALSVGDVRACCAQPASVAEVA